MGIKEEIKNVLNHLLPSVDEFTIAELKSGHINQTFKVVCNGKSLLLQKMNTEVFQNLEKIQENILLVAQHLKESGYSHTILNPLCFKNKSYLFKNKWRAFEFTENTIGFEKVDTTPQALEAAQFLSEFLLHLNDLDSHKIQNSLPEFLDFNRRFMAFKKAIQKGDSERVKQAEAEIEGLLAHQYILEDWNEVSPLFPHRIIHADPKISNFLFDKNNTDQIVALIDWDTLMQGPILYDFGDMVRSFTGLKSEDDPEKGDVFSLANYRAVKKGFLYHLRDNLLEIELKHLDLAAKTIIYVQSMRFLTDYLAGDNYYHIHYKNQNLNRAQNQLNLLEELIKSIK